MDERRDDNRNETEWRSEIEPTSSAPHRGRWLTAGVLAVIAAGGLALGYGYRQRYVSSEVASDNASTNATNATIAQMQGQIDSLNAKLNEVTTAATMPSIAAQPAVDPTAAKRRTAAENKRFKQLESQLTDQQQQLKDTQDQVARTGADLEGNLDSTRDALNGSIARTHDELVGLEQKGERSYFEFDLTKAKHFQRMGPVALSLRKADAKHKNYDLAMVVDDNQISKKHVNLYEPIWIVGTDTAQVQVVVNKIDKDHVHGYVSAPKYTQSASLTPASSQTDATPTVSTPTEPAVNQSTSPSPSSDGETSSPTTTTQLPQ
jgi:uncharacterized coiled-coil protein SlyX